MIKIPLTEGQEHALIRYGKRLFDYGYTNDQVYANMVGFCRDNYGFWMTEGQAVALHTAALNQAFNSEENSHE